MKVPAINIYPHIFPSLNVAQTHPVENACGPGLRYVIWLQGCLRRCPGCINSDFIPLQLEKVVEVDFLIAGMAHYADEMTNRNFAGITLTGGEPIIQAAALIPLVRRVQESGLSVVCYTGYNYEELLDKEQDPLIGEFFKYIDILIDGEYKKDLPRGGVYCASSNQQVRFLTDRYSPGDIEGRPETAFALGKNGILFAGILPQKTTDELARRLKKFGIHIKADDI